MVAPVRRGFLWALALVLLAVICLVITIQFVGNGPGEPCRDSYSCAGFFIGGAECVQTGTSQYCTRYCETDADCAPTWSCGDAHPTVLTIETTYVDKVCIKPKGKSD